MPPNSFDARNWFHNKLLVLLRDVSMFSLGLRLFSPDNPAFSHNPNTYIRGKVNGLTQGFSLYVSPSIGWTAVV